MVVQVVIPLLSDFTDLAVKGDVEDVVAQDADIPYPFRYQIEKWQKEAHK